MSSPPDQRIALGEKIAGGRTAEVYACAADPDRVVKLYVDADADVDGEATRTRVAGEAGAPAPAVFGTVTVDGRPGIVLERVEGPTMLATLQAAPWRLPALSARLAAVHASINQCPDGRLPATTDRLVRRIERVGLPRSAERRIRERIEELPDGRQLCHGDFHPDNVVLTDDGPRVIDWVDATAGPPAADVARTVLLLSLATGDGPLSRAVVATMRTLLVRRYRRRYVDRTGVDPESVRRWLLPVAAARIDEAVPGERARLRAYVDRLLRRPGDPGLR